MRLVITIDTSGAPPPAVALDADASDPIAVTFIAQHTTAVTNRFKQIAAAFYATHTARDHARQRQKLITIVLADLAANFPAQTFTLSVVAGSVSAAVKGA